MTTLLILAVANVLLAIVLWVVLGKASNDLIGPPPPTDKDFRALPSTGGVLVIDNAHPLSADRGCVISTPGRTISGIRAVLTPEGHFIDDGEQVHPVREVVFYPSVSWARRAVRDRCFLTEAEQGIRAANTYPGVDVDTWWCVMFGDVPTTLRAALEMFKKLPANR